MISSSWGVSVRLAGLITTQLVLTALRVKTGAAGRRGVEVPVSGPPVYSSRAVSIPGGVHAPTAAHGRRPLRPDDHPCRHPDPGLLQGRGHLEEVPGLGGG